MSAIPPTAAYEALGQTHAHSHYPHPYQEAVVGFAPAPAPAIAGAAAAEEEESQSSSVVAEMVSAEEAEAGADDASLSLSLVKTVMDPRAPLAEAPPDTVTTAFVEMFRNSAPYISMHRCAPAPPCRLCLPAAAPPSRDRPVPISTASHTQPIATTNHCYSLTGAPSWCCTSRGTSSGRRPSNARLTTWRSCPSSASRSSSSAASRTRSASLVVGSHNTRRHTHVHPAHTNATILRPPRPTPRSTQIDRRLRESNAAPRYCGDVRITDSDTLRIVKEEAGYARCEIESILSRGFKGGSIGALFLSRG